jgi:hypothetical protein
MTDKRSRSVAWIVFLAFSATARVPVNLHAGGHILVPQRQHDKPEQAGGGAGAGAGEGAFQVICAIGHLRFVIGHLSGE